MAFYAASANVLFEARPPAIHGRLFSAMGRPAAPRCDLSPRVAHALDSRGVEEQRDHLAGGIALEVDSVDVETAEVVGLVHRL